MPEKTTSHDAISTVTDPIDQLPLRLLRSEIIPPAPTRSQSSIDWLPDFAGYSWLAYGASTLLVISHLPSPLRGEDSTNGSIFRQILEVSGDGSSPVTSVAWSPVTPSVGELAVGSGNCVCLFARDLRDLKGCFCWSQNAILVQETKVEAIEWTGSGDGIIVGGIDIVLWKRKNQSWEIAWKVSGDYFQDLVSSTSLLEGSFATATSWSKFTAECDEGGKSVLAYCCDGESYRKVELPHPQRISMIQWRPVAAEQSTGKSVRNVLMTCCLDGAVRLWSEVDGGKTKKGMEEHKKSFSVAAVIEINQVLDGYLGRDLFISWGTRAGGILKTIEGTNQYFSTEKYDHDNVGHYEWLVGYGPGKSASLWAVHCLDDISTVRIPRITLWARQESNEIGVVLPSLADATGSSDQLLLKKVSVLRNNRYGPPLICSSVYLSPSNTVYWSSLHTIKSPDSEDSSANKSSELKCMTGKILDLDGHGGKILQVAFNPILCEEVYIASLDCNGLIIFWSLCDNLNRAIDHPISVSSWKPCGRLQNQELRLKYTSICWAPSALDDERFLLVGHVEGITFFSVKNCGRGYDSFLTRYICTIPFASSHFSKNGPTSIFATPLPNSCGMTFKSNRFLLLSMWMEEKRFDALSWSVSMHHFSAAGSTCDCHFHAFDSNGLGKWLYEDTFGGKTNCIAVRSCSSEIPDAHRYDEVTSFAVVNPSSRALKNDMNIESQAYTMATGQADGSLKLWRCSLQECSTPSVPWELVGMLTIGQNPVSAISLTDSGRKIAALCRENHSKDVHTVSIWEIVHLIDSGVFILEDKLHVDEEVVSVRWSSVSNDQLLLGVCTQKEMRVYGIARQPCRSTSFAVSEYSSEARIWQCFAVTRTSSAIHDLWWGTKAMTALVHNDYVSLHGQWLAVIDKTQKIDNYPEIFAGNLPNLVNATEEGRDSKLLSNSGINDLKKADTVSISRGCIPLPPTSNAVGDWQSISMPLTGTPYGSDATNGITSMLHMVEKLGGALPLYHPQALLVAIRSGNWKRASAALRHLADYITSSDATKKDYAVKLDLCPDVLLSKYYEGSLSNGPNLKAFQWGGTSGSMLQNSQYQAGFPMGLQSNFSMDSYSPNSSQSSPATDLKFSGFCEQLKKLSDGGNIGRIEKMQYFAIVDLLCEISNPDSTSVFASLDEAGRRFWVTLRFKQLYLARSSGKTASLEELDIDSSMIGWAFHSESQENLSASLLPNESSWQQMQSLGFGFWYSNVAQLRSRMEKLARQQYLKNKNPKDCALLYIALNRIQVLAGLFKISRDEKDKPLVAFLSRNFQEEKNKAAALKNAYVLMGKHQLEMAIGFFLLGGEASTAINVCVKNLQDEQLALVICRLVDGQGGALESNLIKKNLLPSAVQRGDFWLASLLKWELGEYHQSFLAMAGCLENHVTGSSTVTSNHISFVDPSIGLYCLMLTTKNSVKNALGERNASNLTRWATLMTATAFNRCGLWLEALECLSASASSHGGTHQASGPSNGHLRTPLELSVPDTSNWVLSSASSTVDTHFRLGLAVQFLSKQLREATALLKNSENVSCETLSGFHHRLQTALEQLYQRFSLSSSCLRNMMILSAENDGLLSMGYNIFQENSSFGLSVDKSHTDEDLFQYSALCKLILKATEEKSFVLSRIIAACSVSPCFEENKVSSGPEPKWSNALRFYFQGILQSFSSLRISIRLHLGSAVEDLRIRLAVVLDLVEYCSRLAMAWILGDVNCLFRMVQPLTISFFDGHTPYEVDLESLKTVYHQEVSVSVSDELDVGVNSVVENNEVRYPVHSIPEDERRLVTHACFWKHVSDFVKHKLESVSIDLDDGISNSGSVENGDAQTSLDSSGDIVRVTEKIMSVLGKTMISSFAQLSSYHVKQLVLHLKQKIEKRIQVPTLLWLHECRESETHSIDGGISDASIENEDNDDLMSTLAHFSSYLVKQFVLPFKPKIENPMQVPTLLGLHDVDLENEDNGDLTVSVRFWKLCVDPHLVSEAFVLENFDISEWSKYKPLEDWGDMYREVTEKNELNVPRNQDGRSSHVSSSSQKAAVTANVNSAFQKPKEIQKRTGELVEALCMNTINHRQAALASNRKGLIFFSLEDGGSCDDQSNYIWSDADWPHNGWANSESTPVPTFDSLDVGLGDKEGAHVGLGVSGLGTETQEEFVDPPPTVENVITRAFSSHPTMPLFLVGSSHTHIYLWEFGKNRAITTYGVRPTATDSHPHALASISAVQFGPSGQRFASAALDGTVCTWQSEVGGRSNIHPIESFLCFNGHASDVEYISSSGSIVAASGHSSTGVNVVLWDTLAPPSASQTSISCHEGGARSISVFDNDIGSGSISPMIITGGTTGDVGLHDFRYVATGKSKKQDHNKNGMLWYIPKAHLGSVTKISTIPHTSLFLTGSKDGDVKLWDAKAAKLIHHWPKLHERHTFLQPTSFGYGGIIRAGVTDIQVCPNGFISCGGDGTVKFISLRDS